jgi:hypothetical protein
MGYVPNGLTLNCETHLVHLASYRVSVPTTRPHLDLTIENTISKGLKYNEKWISAQCLLNHFLDPNTPSKNVYLERSRATPARNAKKGSWGWSVRNTARSTGQRSAVNFFVLSLAGASLARSSHPTSPTNETREHAVAGPITRHPPSSLQFGRVNIFI